MQQLRLDFGLQLTSRVQRAIPPDAIKEARMATKKAAKKSAKKAAKKPAKKAAKKKK
jgi:hypothetical protein